MRCEEHDYSDIILLRLRHHHKPEVGNFLILSLFLIVFFHFRMHQLSVIGKSDR